MKNPLRILLCVSCFATQWHITMASHIVGGEMSYICLGNNQYQITLKVFRDCFNGQAAYDNPTDITIYDANNVQVPGSPFPVFFPGSDTLDNDTGNPCLILPPGICVEEADFVTTVTLPPGSGYTIVYQRCCRNIIIVNLVDPSNTGASYVSTIPDSSLAICNSSPYYNNFPPTVICVDVPFVFDHSATDPDGDSLVYQLCAPYVGGSSFNAYPIPAAPPPYGFVNYQAPYTAADPMGGNPPMAIDPVTGLLTVTPNTIGNFVVGVCVEEYRNGNFLGEHKRDFQFNVTQCTPSVLASIPSFINDCSGYTITFDNNSIGGTVYHWDFGTGVTGDTSNLFEPSFTFPDTGIYTVTLMVNPGTTCGDTATAQVYIYPTFTGLMDAPDGCVGQPVQFFDQSTTSFGVVDSWKWNFDDGGTSNLQDPTHTYSDTGDYTVQFIVGTDLGCVDTVYETIHIYPAPPTTVIPSDTTICYLDFVQLNASGSGTFSWQPNYNLSNINTSNPVASPDVTTTYTVTLSNNFGCFTQDSVTIHVFDTVIVHAGNDTTICPGGFVQLNATGIGVTVFSWSPSTGLNNPNIPNPIATPAVTTTYFVTSSIGSCVGSDAITISVKPFPAIFVGPDFTICEGDTAQLSVSGGTSYTWSPAGTLSDPSSATPMAFPNSTTSYVVTGLDSNSCNISVVDTEKVNVIPRPDIVITADTTIILGTCIDLSITGGGTYQWFPDVELSDVTSATPTACPTDQTMYYVWITTDLGCKYIDSVLIDVNPEPLVIFPSAFSPNDDGKNDVFRPVVLGLASIDAFRIYNRWGVVVFEATSVSVVGGPMPVAESWDGKYKDKEQPVGVYVYYLRGTGTATGTTIERQGDVTLVR